MLIVLRLKMLDDIRPAPANKVSDRNRLRKETRFYVVLNCAHRTVETIGKRLSADKVGRVGS